MSIHTKELENSLARIMKFFGLSQMAGKIWAYLLIKGDYATQKEIGHELKISRGLISRNLSKLKNLGIINVSRKSSILYYSSRMSFLSAFNKMVKEYMDAEITLVQAKLESSREKLSGNNLRILPSLSKDCMRIKKGLEMLSKTLELN